MRFIVLDIRVGSVGKKHISASRMEYYMNVAKILFPNDSIHNCYSSEFSVPLDYRDNSNEPEKIKIIVADTFFEDINSDNPCGLYIIDFTANNFDLPRESLLIHLWVKLGEYFEKFENLKFLVLLKNLPSSGAFSNEVFKLLEKDIGNNSVILIENSGEYLKIPKNVWDISFNKKTYHKLVDKLEKSPILMLKNKLVRRLGNFPQSENKKETRLYSYLIDNCDEELIRLIKDWWKKIKIEYDAIIYDSPNIESLSIAVKRFSLEKDLKFYRMGDLLKNNNNMISEASKHERCLLILDVVGTGNTLVKYTNFLKEKDISISTNILTTINKNGVIETKIGDYNIKGFLKVDRDPLFPIQIQRELNLPLTSDNCDTYDKLRAFDFWYMAYKVGWESETDVPDNIGYRYPIVPIFTKMLSEYGDWIAYKMEQFLKKINYPQNFFVIHPDEGGANSVSDKLTLRFNRLIIIKIPRSAIKLAQSKNNNWAEVFSEKGENENWYIELKSIRNASALITDVFNASGSTFSSIYELLNYLRIDVFCYFPYVDRDCYCKDAKKYPVKKFSLYDWYGPRKLK